MVQQKQGIYFAINQAAKINRIVSIVINKVSRAYLYHLDHIDSGEHAGCKKFASNITGLEEPTPLTRHPQNESGLSGHSSTTVRSIYRAEADLPQCRDEYRFARQRPEQRLWFLIR